jgi:hypothetical protein
MYGSMPLKSDFANVFVSAKERKKNASESLERYKAAKLPGLKLCKYDNGNHESYPVSREDTC